MRASATSAGYFFLPSLTWRAGMRRRRRSARALLFTSYGASYPWGDFSVLRCLLGGGKNLGQKTSFHWPGRGQRRICRRQRTRTFYPPPEAMVIPARCCSSTKPQGLFALKVCSGLSSTCILRLSKPPEQVSMVVIGGAQTGLCNLVGTGRRRWQWLCLDAKCRSGAHNLADALTSCRIP